MDKLKTLAQSRKFWAALIGLSVVILKNWWPDLPLDADQLTAVVWLLAAYILGVAVEDGAAAARR